MYDESPRPTRPSIPSSVLGERHRSGITVVAAVVAAGSEKAAAHRPGLSYSTVKHHLAKARSEVGAPTTAQLVWILAPRLPDPEDAPSRGLLSGER